MSSTTNKNKLFALAFFVVFPLFLVETARSIETGGIHVISPVSPETLKILKVLFGTIAGISFSIPWLMYKRLNSYQPKRDLLIAKFMPGNPGLMLGYSYLFSPVIYGLVLFFAGMSVSELYYFVGLSIIGALAWGIFTFRRM